MKKSAKIFLFSLLGLVVLVAALAGFGYYNYWGKFSVDEEKYPHNVEFIDPEKALLNKGFKVCDENRIAQYYNPRRASYSQEKNGLRSFIMKKYQNKDYKDSGYLNIRFIINCEGEAGRYIIHENNLNLEPTQLNPDMVNQLFDITSKLKKWNPVYHRERYWDSYIYISYRIEHGEIIEILP